MALIKCAECGGSVSTEAKACPHCGAAVGKRASYLWLIALPIGAVVVFLAIGFINSSPMKSRERAAIDECWKTARTIITGSAARKLADATCRSMIDEFERKHGPSPSLPRH